MNNSRRSLGIALAAIAAASLFSAPLFAGGHAKKAMKPKATKLHSGHRFHRRHLLSRRRCHRHADQGQTAAEKENRHVRHQLGRVRGKCPPVARK